MSGCILQKLIPYGLSYKIQFSKPYDHKTYIRQETKTANLQFRYHRLALVQPLYRIAHHLVHNLLCALSLVYHGGSFAHQERSCIVHRLVVNVIP